MNNSCSSLIILICLGILNNTFLKAGGRIKGKSESDSDSAKEFTITKLPFEMESDDSRFRDKSEEQIENKRKKTIRRNKPCIACKGTYKKHWGLR